MDPRFLAHYNRELLHLRDMAGEFAAEYPKIAGRLGLDGFECADPYVERLLEGFAYMAARVQLKFDSGYTRFTQHLLDTVAPDALAPLPSMLVAQFEPDLRDPALATGHAVARGSALRGRLAPDEQTACEYRTGHETTLWPLMVREAAYLSRAGDLAALGIAPERGAQAGIRLVFDVTAGLRADQLALDRLPLFLRGSETLPAHLVEQLLGHRLGFVVRPLAGAGGGEAGRAVWRDADCLRAMGYADDEALLPAGARAFSGHRLLREYFAFPSRFHFVEFTALRPALQRCAATAFEIVVLLARADPALERALDASAFALHCVPAINLFPKRADRVLLNDRDTEHHLVADRTRPLDYEVHSVTGVVGHGGAERLAFQPFYAVGRHGQAGAGAYFSLNRMPRQVSSRQRRKGARSSHLGTEVYLSLVDARETPLRGELRELAVDTLCTNRDLPLLMPLGGSDDFSLDAAAPLTGIRCVKGPSRPRPPHDDGQAHWQLINQLSLSYLGLLDSDAGQGAAALRDLLALHADSQEPAAGRQIEGLRHVSQRPIHRRLPSAGGPICHGRGLELTLTCDDVAYEGSGAFLLAAVLEQFFARHVSINSFTETVLRSTTRGEVMRWPARPGRRQPC
jgi:type VI secretion system protein ImpG